MFPANEFKQAKASSFYNSKSKENLSRARIGTETPSATDVKKEEEKKSSNAILEKLESICEKLAKNDTLVAEFKQKQDELFKAFEKKDPYFPEAKRTDPATQDQAPNSNFVTSIAQSACAAYAAPQNSSQQEEKKKKKNYKKLTPDLATSVYDRYPQLPKEKDLYTTDGEDLYAMHKNKKVLISNLGDVLSLIK
jgi:hypothetical protein